MLGLPFVRDRRAAIGAIILVASAVVLAVGLFGIFSAVFGGTPDLPSQGTISEIVGDAGGAASPAPAGPPASAPVRFEIPRLYIDAPVVTLGVDGTNTPQVPDRPDQVAWYNFSAAVGRGGNAVFAGHVDWQTRSGAPIPGVFYRLRELKIGDPMDITLEDGARVEYRVTGNVATAYNDPNVVKAMDGTANDVITLITCGGSWIKDPSKEFGGNYSHRVIVRAERVTNAARNNDAAASG
jgi:LPXTG-site transpeptidase (sortase) family protein